MAYFKKQYHPPGTAPGTLKSTSQRENSADIRLLAYTGRDVKNVKLTRASDCKKYLEEDTKVWIQVNGAATPDTLRELGELFGLHELALEDVLNSGQRPKLEQYDDHLFLIAAMPRLSVDGVLEISQISLFIGKNYLICLSPLPEDPFDPIRHRLHDPQNNRFAQHDIDYLLYALLDLITDSGFPVLEQIGDRLEDMEVELLENPAKETLANLHTTRQQLMTLRRTLWPQRELLTNLMHTDLLIDRRTLVYLRDCHDHSVLIIELLESFREMATSMLEIYLSSVSQRTNDTMRVLTIIATIFIPLTFITGVYGMNFQNPDSPWAMPELHWHYGYPLIWGVMIALTVWMIRFFKRRGWL